MARNNLTILFAAGLFIGLPAYAVIISIDYQRYYAPEEYWKEEVDGARSSVEFSAGQLESANIRLQRLKRTRDSRIEESRAGLSSIFPGENVDIRARENARSETEVARSLVSSFRESLNNSCEDFRKAASRLRGVSSDSSSLDLRLPSSCD